MHARRAVVRGACVCALDVARAGALVHRDRQAGVVDGIPERLVDRVVPRGRAHDRHHRRREAHARDALDLFDGGVDLPRRYQPCELDAIGMAPQPLVDPVVVDPAGSRADGTVPQVPHVETDGGVDDLTADAVLGHHPEPHLRRRMTDPLGLQLGRPLGRHGLPADLVAVDDERPAAVALPLDAPRGGVSHRGRQTLVPQVVGLVDVRVRRDGQERQRVLRVVDGHVPSSV